MAMKSTVQTWEINFSTMYKYYVLLEKGFITVKLVKIMHFFMSLYRLHSHLIEFYKCKLYKQITI